MKKVILSLLFLSCIVRLSAVAEPFMDKALSSWIGYPIDSVIESWGYPDSQQTIAGRNIYIWEERNIVENSSYERSEVRTDKNGRTHVDTYSYGGGISEYYCKKILEVDAENRISGYQYKGNACPVAYFLSAKKLVNPDNNEWQKKKIEKQIQKSGY